MLRAVLADLHLGQAAGDMERFRHAVADLRHRGVGEVVFLGDLFRTLVGLPRFWGGVVETGLGELAALRAAGVRVVLVEGNRDFFLDTDAMSPFLDVFCRSHSFACGGRRFLLEHGDLVNRSDRAYRMWRAVSKSGAARVWALLLPRRLALQIVTRTERRLARTNFSYRRELPVADLTEAARRHFAAGVDVLLWGHFHRSWQLRAGDKEARVVSGWCDSGEVLLVHGDGRLVAVESGSESPSH